MIHTQYNLSFINRVHDGMVIKGCSLADKTNSSFVNLSYYLLQIQYPENISEGILLEVERVLEGNPQDDVYFAVGSEFIQLSLSSTSIIDNNKTEVLPTIDFKEILQEYLNFLHPPP